MNEEIQFELEPIQPKPVKDPAKPHKNAKKPESNRKNTTSSSNPGILSRLQFSFVYKIIKLANELHRKGESLNEKHLPDLAWSDKAQNLGEQILARLEHQKQANKKPRLEILLFNMFKSSIIFVFLTQTFGMLLHIVMVLFAKYLLEALSDHNVDISEAFKWAGILCGSLIIAVYNENHSFYQSSLLMNRIRIGLTSAIYSKITKMSLFSLNQISTGKILNIITNDVNIFETIGLFFTTVLVGPIGLVAGGAVLWTFFGPSCLVGIGFLALSFPIQRLLMSCVNKSRDERNNISDERIRLTNEIIEGIRLLKMYTWENTLRDNIKNVRSKEVSLIKRVLAFEGASQGFAMSVQSMASFLIFLTFVLTGGELTVSIVFPTLFLIGYMKMAVVMFFAISMSFTGEVKLMFPRILAILEAPELTKKPSDNEVKDSYNAIELENFSGYWTKLSERSDDKPTLDNISLNMKKKSLNALIGKVGCGKSSFLLAFTGEMPRTTGTMRFQGKIAYVEQEAVIFSGTLRENILFGKEYNEEFYNKVISSCSLDGDFREFSNGDLSEIGERGINLSGGQKARVALARAIYSDADIYLLDDPLSAVDAKVAKKLYQEAINGLLKEKTVILVTHQVYFVKEAENIIMMEEGKIVSNGGYEDLKRQGISVEEIFNKEEDKAKISETEEDHEEKDLLIPTQEEKIVEEVKIKAQQMDEKGGCLFVDEDKYMGDLNFKTYTKYFSEMGSKFFLLILLLLVLSNEVANIAFSRILGVWATGDLDQTTSIIIVASLAVFLLVVYIVKTIMFYCLTVKAADSHHNRMLDRIVRCSSEFFDTNPVGRILNRFSNDLGVMDRFLPWTVCDVSEVGFSTVSMLITVAVISPLTLIPVVIATIVIGFILKICYQCIQQSKEYELSSRSPVYSHLSSTLSGITIIRVYNQLKNFKQTFARLLNDSSRGSFAFWNASRWYGFYVDLLYTLSAVASILIITALRDTQPELAGLSLSFILGITGVLQFGVKGAVEINVVMTSVSRIQAYCELPSEAELVKNGDEKLQNENWPQEGKVQFKDVYMRYRKDTENVIKGLTFDAKPGEKIGCVGRTGAGKSSIIQLLFRMVEINHEEPGHEEGQINIDDINAETVGLHLLRKSISIIPQSPFIFSGTIKRNLDPLNRHTEEELWRALEEVNLKSCVDRLDNQLHTDMTNVSSVFSTGQKQLVCLARTILKQSRILVLDEATANVDFETDKIIQKKVRDRFKKCTTFTIAHRLSTIANYDKILVLDKGKVVEFSEPYRLLVKQIGDDHITNPTGHFSSMVLNTGPKVSQQIFDIAKQQYMEMHSNLICNKIIE